VVDATLADHRWVGVEDDIAVQVHLLNFSLFGLTRATRSAQTKQLLELREQP
jgi:hypothetical protein